MQKEIKEGIKTNVHIYPSPIINESRMMKISKSLCDAGIFSEILLVGRRVADFPHIDQLDCTRTIVRVKAGPCGTSLIRKAMQFIYWYWNILVLFWNYPLACINSHSLSVLPLCALLKLRHKGILIYDTHELETETITAKRVRKTIAKITERLFIGFTDAIIVVSPSIAAWYRQRYSRNNVWVIRNVPYRRLALPQKNELLRNALGIKESEMVFLYQGVLSEGRGIDLLLRTFASMSVSKHIVFMGYGPMEQVVKAHAKIRPNIHYYPAVRPEDVGKYARGADVGLAIIENKCLSYYYCLPNKMFEYIISGVPVIVSDFPDMGDFVGERFGWQVNPDFTSVAKLIQSLDKAVIEEKRKQILAERNTFGWQEEEGHLLDIYCKMGLSRIYQ